MEGSTHPIKSESSSIPEMLQFFSQELGLSMKEAVTRVAEDLDIPRREVYRIALQLKGNPAA
jgi:NADH:ubiquinone oxidoreductase subunit E